MYARLWCVFRLCGLITVPHIALSRRMATHVSSGAVCKKALFSLPETTDSGLAYQGHFHVKSNPWELLKSKAISPEIARAWEWSRNNNRNYDSLQVVSSSVRLNRKWILTKDYKFCLWKERVCSSTTGVGIYSSNLLSSMVGWHKNVSRSILSPPKPGWPPATTLYC